MSVPAVHALDVGRICQRNVISVAADEDIAAAARVMREKHVGYLIVTEPFGEAGAAQRRVVGVLTDRDIVVAVVARDVQPHSLKVGDVMTRNPLLVAEDCSMDGALTFMREAGVRRVPVVGARRELVGVLSMDDVLEKLAQQLTNVAASFRAEQHAETVMRP